MVLNRLCILQFFACVLHFNVSYMFYNSRRSRLSISNSDSRPSVQSKFTSRHVYPLNGNKGHYEYNADSENYLMHLFEEKRPSVVYIGGYVQPFNAWLFDLELMSISQSGSGFIWDDRHIITNYHVVRDINPSNIYITVLDSTSSTSDSSNSSTVTKEAGNNQIVRKTMKVSLHGYDADRDIAVLRVISDSNPTSSKAADIGGNADARFTASVATYLKTMENDLNKKTISGDSGGDKASSSNTKSKSDKTTSKFKLPPPLPIGDSNSLRVGQSVIAIGNPFGLDQTLTTGIISGLNRRVGTTGGNTDRSTFQKPKNPPMLYNLIQTDAAINPGNSGGPLLELKSGKVIGMNTALISTSGAFAGIGLAIPIDTIQVVVNILIRGTAGSKLKTADSGIDYASGFQAKLLGVTQGLVVLKVQKNSPADYAGIRGVAADTNTGAAVLGDVIKKVNEINVNSEADFLSAIDKASISGDIVDLTVLRNIERSAAAIQMESSSQTQAQKQQSSSSQQTQAPIMKEIKLKLKLKFS